MTPKNIENLYVLSPIQQGLLFHSLYAPESGLYIDQIILELHGHLNIPVLELAWQRVVDRHVILRTSFHWENLNKPLQVIHSIVRLPFEVHDWRDQAPRMQEEMLASYLNQDRRRGFNFSEAPLMRLTLIQVSEHEYKLIWTLHHIILDGWSTSILYNEVLAFYEALRKGEGLYLEQAPPFSAYISWLRRQDLAEAGAFWHRYLKGFTTQTSLTIDRGRSGRLKEGETYQETQLSVAMTSALQSLARQHQLTLNTLAQGAWGLLLSRYAGAQDVVFGVTVSGRPETIAGIESMVGILINTLPVRFQVRPDESALTVLKKLQAQQVEIHNYEFTPLVEIHKSSEVPAGQGLFESILVFENSRSTNLPLEYVSNSLRIRGSRHQYKTNYPLSVQVSPGQGLIIRVDYDRNRFSPDAITRMIGHLANLLAEFIAGLDRPVSALQLLTESEIHQLLWEWNDTRADYPLHLSVREMFEAQAERSPGAVALVFGDEELTYGELNARANQLAHYLRTLGASPEAPVGLCCERSLEMIVGILGILKAGGACVPLDPAYPEQRLAFIAEDTRMPILLSQKRLVERLPKQVDQVVWLDSDWQDIARQSQQSPVGHLNADNLAYVIYTSGSTGTPKGAQVCHRAILRLLFGVEYARFGPSETFLQLAPISFDASILEIWGALLHGGRLVLFPNEDLTPENLDCAIRQHGVTSLWLTASLFNMVIDENPNVFSSIRQLMTGGETLSVFHIEQALECLSSTQLINGYGPTEGTTFSICYRIPYRSDRVTSSIPIGRPIANTQIYLLDQQLNPVPVGVAGELYIGGDGLARGYLNQPELTAEKFIPDIFSKEPGQRLYKTGDLARYLTDGMIEFLGRIDHQVKVRGYRVEPEEIESVLMRHPYVRAAAVIARKENSGAAVLEAYVVAEQATTPQASELRDFLKDILPGYMIPSAFILLESLPLTPSGKIDRRALRQIEGATGQQNKSYIAPRNPIEELLASMWSAVLGIEKISIHDDFLELGGHSLLATQLISRTREAFKIEIPLRSLFEMPTVASLAENIEKNLRAGSQTQAPPLRPVSRDVDLPLSFAQQRLWILDQFDPGLPTYNIPMATTIIGALNITAMRQSLNEIVRRHESLRTSFIFKDGQPVQVIAPSHELTVELEDLSDLSEMEQEAELHQFANHEACKRFDLACGPLLRVTLLKLGKQKHVLLLTMHHIVSDGWSLGVFFREMVVLYEAYVNATPSPLPELSIQYADYAIWQRQWLRDDALDSLLAFWKEQLNGAPGVLELPVDRRRPLVQSFRGGRQRIALTRKVSDALNALAQSERVTMFMALLAGFKVLLYRYTGERDLLVGSPIANRNHVETENLIGFFVNTLVLRTDLSGSPSFRELLKRVREVTMAAYTHQELPFEKLVEELHPERNLSLSPLFQVMFALLNAPNSGHEPAGLVLEPMEVDSGLAKFDLTLSMLENKEGVTGFLEYNSDIFDASTARRLLGHYQSLLEGAIANPDLQIADLPMVSEAEQHQLLIEWNDTASIRSPRACLHELFEAQVERTPNSIALTFNNEQLTYSQLNCRANQVAHRLYRIGVRPEFPVGIFMERSTEMVVGLLGVLKAGGAYVPLDPAYPKERLAFMLEDVNASVVLAQEWLIDRLPQQQLEIIRMDASEEEFSGESDTNLNLLIEPQNLAYVIYTSGSTGKPKGVAIEHRSAVVLLDWARETFSGDALAGVLASTSICFDLSVFELFAPLSFGGIVILVESVLDLLGLDAADQVKLINTVPSAIAELVKVDALPASAHTINLAGEPIPADVIEQVYSQEGVERVFNLYGPSEDTTYSTFALVERASKKSPPIGRPIANTQVYLLDKQLQPVPIGVIGELYISGKGLARGYFNRAQLTAERFIPSPFGEEPGARLYRTGDLARYLPDGRIDFLGRVDHQVKIRGFRIEPGEVEALLRQHPAINEAVVLAREDVPGDKRLAAYLVPSEQSAYGVRRFITPVEQDHPFANKPLCNLPNGLSIAHLGEFQTIALYKEIFEDQLYLKHGVTLNDGDCVFDVGANIGLFSFFVQQRCEGAKIYAFEPLPPNFEILRTNATLYGLNWKLFDCGLSSKTEMATFTFFPNLTGLSGRFSDPEEKRQRGEAILTNWLQMNATYQERKIVEDDIDAVLNEYYQAENYTCRLTTISDVINENNVERIDLLKVDTERGEFGVLAGIRQEHWQKIKQIVIEVHTRELLEQITRLLQQQDYDCVVEETVGLEGSADTNFYASMLYAVRRGERSDLEQSSIIPANPDLLIDELRRYLRKKLPDYMIPSAFIILDSLPMTPNGKIDRGALPAPNDLRPRSEKSYVAPRTELEQTIAGIWREALHRNDVGIHDNFFSDLGGHSLLVIQIVGNLREALNGQVSVVEIFQFPTIYSLANHLSAIEDEQLPLHRAQDVTRVRQQSLKQRRSMRQIRQTTEIE